MTITISSEDPRSIKAIQIAADADQWLKCRTADGRKAFGVPSQRTSGRYYLVTCETCDCEDFKRIGLGACKHCLAVRLHCELAKAQAQPRRRSPLQPVRINDDEIVWDRPKLPPMTDEQARKIFGRL